MKNYKFTDDSLQSQAIDLLKNLGADKDSLWLVEVSSIPTAKKFYPARTIDDLTQYKAESEDSIIYYHESGSIHKHETFDSDDPQSFAAAVAEVARDLGAEFCPECYSTDLAAGKLEADDQEYKICNNCGHRWYRDSYYNKNVII